MRQLGGRLDLSCSSPKNEDVNTFCYCRAPPSSSRRVIYVSLTKNETFERRLGISMNVSARPSVRASVGPRVDPLFHPSFRSSVATFPSNSKAMKLDLDGLH